MSIQEESGHGASSRIGADTRGVVPVAAPFVDKPPGSARPLSRGQRMAAYLVAFSVTLYAYLMVRGSPVFPLSLLVPGIICLGLLRSVRTMRLNPLLAVYAAYLLWPLVSFPFASVLVHDIYGWSVLQFQLTSLVYFYLCAMPAIIGYRLGRAEGAELRPLLGGFKLSLLLNIGFVFVVFFYYFPDMYLSRAVVKQRLPLIICYLSTLLLVYGSTFTRFARVLSFSGIVAVALSLSRASFLQLLASLVALAIIFPTAFLRMLWRQKAFLLLGLLGGTLLVFTPSRATAVVDLVSARFSALMAPRNLDTEDYSASVRIEIWRSLGREIQSHPASYLFGFGQLGPSFIGAGFTTSEGEAIADYSAHNQYLDTLVRAGVPGLGSELLLMLAVIYCACVGRFPTAAQRRFALGNGIALVGVFVFGMFHETLRWNLFAGLFWLFAGWLAAAGSYRWRESAP